MDLSFSEKTDSCSTDQETLRLSWKSAIKNIEPLDRILSHTNPIFRPTLDSLKIRLNNLRLDFASCRFLLILPAKITYKIFIFSCVLYAPTMTMPLM